MDAPKLYSGWTEREIDEEVARMLRECASEEERNDLIELAIEARANGNCWPLRPKFMAPPPLYLEDK